MNAPYVRCGWCKAEDYATEVEVMGKVDGWVMVVETDWKCCNCGSRDLADIDEPTEDVA